MDPSNQDAKTNQGEGAAVPPATTPPTKDELNMAVLAHLLGLVLSFIGPLIIWLIKKDESAFVADQAKEALNFQIMLVIAYAIAGLLTMVCIGFILLPAIFVLQIVFQVMAAVEASKGKYHRYPFNLRLVQ